MNWNIQNGKITVSFPYDPDTVEKVKSVPGRRWKPDSKVWEFPDCLPVRSYLKHLFQVSFSAPEYVGIIEPILTSGVKPYEHQKKMTGAIHWSWANNRHLGLFAETGTGKTKAAIDAIVEIDSVDQRGEFLIVCPAPLLSVWMDEFGKHGLMGCVNRYHGPKRCLDNKKILLTSYETLRNDIELIESYCEFDVAFFDESQKTKDTSTLNHKACRKVRAGTKVLMTGTPYGNSYLDIHGQFHVVDDFIFGNKKTFQSTFCVFGGWENKEVVGWRNLSMLEEIMRRYSIVVRKDECLDLPKKTYQTIKLEMNDEQKRVYRRAEAGAVGDVPITTVLAEIAKLRQISSGFVYSTPISTNDDGVDECLGHVPERSTQSFGTQKIEYLRSIQYCEPTVIWFNFREERNQIVEVLEKYRVPYAVADGENMAAKGVRDFESGVVNVLIAQLQSVQYGFTCNRASRVIYYSPTFSLLQRAQSEDRCHRIGQTKNVHYISLVSSPIEEWMMEAVASKNDVKEHVMQKLRSIFEK